MQRAEIYIIRNRLQTEDTASARRVISTFGDGSSSHTGDGFSLMYGRFRRSSDIGYGWRATDETNGVGSMCRTQLTDDRNNLMALMMRTRTQDNDRVLEFRINDNGWRAFAGQLHSSSTPGA